jgi:hypothetical protein
MKKQHVLIITATLLATSTANSAEPYWEYDCRRGYATKTFAGEENRYDVEGYGIEVFHGEDSFTVRIEPGEIRALQKLLPEIKKCDAWLQCLADRGRGR